MYQLVRNIDSDLTVEEHVSFDKQLCTMQVRPVTQYNPSTSVELNDLIYENDEKEADEEDKCDVKIISDKLKYGTELQKFFLNV